MTRKRVLWSGVGLLALALAGFAVWIFNLPPPSAVAAPPIAAGEIFPASSARTNVLTDSCVLTSLTRLTRERAPIASPR